MNTLKKTLAIVATLAMTATAFASCGGSEESSPAPAASTEEATSAAEEATEAEATEAEEGGEESSESGSKDGTGKLDPSVATGGDTFTVAAWNADDVPALIAQWKGLDKEAVADNTADQTANIMSAAAKVDLCQEVEATISDDDDLEE